jgi:hypothetical protein
MSPLLFDYYALKDKEGTNDRDRVQISDLWLSNLITEHGLSLWNNRLANAIQIPSLEVGSSPKGVLESAELTHASRKSANVP